MPSILRSPSNEFFLLVACILNMQEKYEWIYELDYIATDT